MTDIGLGNAQPAKKAKSGQKRRSPRPKYASETVNVAEAKLNLLSSLSSGDISGAEYDEQIRKLESDPTEGMYDRATEAESVDSRGIPVQLSGEQVSPTLPPKPVNPYAPVGWRKKERVEFDLELPSGQMARVMRLERDDLIRLDLMKYLDTFTPMLLEDAISDEERERRMTEQVKENPEALSKMLTAIDKVAMTATVRPRITEDHDLVNYGDESDWANPDFVAVVHLDDVDQFERMYIFGAAFGRDMDDLKSVLQQTQSVGSVANQPGVQQNTE